MDGVGALTLTQQRLAVVLAGTVVMGIAIPWLLVGYLTAQQRLTPPRLQGRLIISAVLLCCGGTLLAHLTNPQRVETVEASQSDSSATPR